MISIKDVKCGDEEKPKKYPYSGRIKCVVVAILNEYK